MRSRGFDVLSPQPGGGVGFDEPVIAGELKQVFEDDRSLPALMGSGIGFDKVDDRLARE